MIVKVRVKTRQPEFEIKKRDVWLVSLKSAPENNKANAELVREFSRIYGSARILSGFRSKTKTLEIGEIKP